MSGELLLILLVSLIVFGPQKLPMLATHLGQLIKHLQHWRNQLNQVWEEQSRTLELKENQAKAQEADKLYKQQ